MIDSQPSSTAPPHTVPAPAEEPSSRRLSTVLLGLAIAAVLVAGAWFIGGRQGFQEIGDMGINSELLPRAGEPAPDFFTVLSTGEVVRLSDYRGQPVWLNFWGSWCPPCRSEAPEMQAAHEELAPRGLVMLAVALDEPLADAAAYAELNELTYLIAGDPNRELTGAAYPIVNFPTHILIDRDGIVREVILAELNKDQFIAHAEPLLAPGDGS